MQAYQSLLCYSGADLWKPLINEIERLESSENPDELEDLIQVVCDRIDNILPSENEVFHKVLNFQEKIYGTMDLPGCGSCGIRALPTDHPFKLFSLSRLGMMRLSGEQIREFQALNPVTRAIKSVYLHEVGEVTDYYYLHRELIEVDRENQPAVRLCRGCSQAIESGIIPSFSIANGYDYGILSRALPSLVDAPLSLAESLALAPNRLYIELVRIKESTSQQNALVGHAITFPQDSPQRSLETLASIANQRLQNDGNRDRSHCALRVLTSLQIVFVGPQSMHDAMRRAGLRNRNLRVRPATVLNALEALKCCNPTVFQDVPDLTQVQREVFLRELGTVTEELVNRATYLQEDADLLSENIASDNPNRVPSERGLFSPSNLQNGTQLESDIALSHLTVTSRSAISGSTEELEYASLLALQGVADNQSIRSAQISNEPINEFIHNKSLIAGTFPHLFPLGFVTKSESLKPDEVEHILRQFTSVFAEESRFIFLLFNQLQRHSAAQSVSVSLKNQENGFLQFNNLLHDREFLDALNRSIELGNPLRTLSVEEVSEARQAREMVFRNAYPVIRFSGQTVPYSSMERSSNLSKLYALTEMYGPPTIF